MLKPLDALEVLKKGLEFEKENEQILKLIMDIDEEYKTDNSLPYEDPERQRFEKMLTWLKQGNSKFDKLKIRYYGPDYRGVHASRDIKKGEIILLVPYNQIITLEMAFASPIGAKMYEKGLRGRLISPKHSFLCTFIMQEKRKEVSEWHTYIDILPKNLSNFPIFFTAEDKEWLKGSPFLE